MEKSSSETIELFPPALICRLIDTCLLFFDSVFKSLIVRTLKRQETDRKNLHPIPLLLNAVAIESPGSIGICIPLSNVLWDIQPTQFLKFFSQDA